MGNKSPVGEFAARKQHNKRKYMRWSDGHYKRRVLKLDKKFPCSEGKQYRDFVHVDDVVSAIMKCINKKTANGQIFNLGTGKPIKIKKLIILIRDKIGDGYPDFGKIKLRNEETLKIFPKINKIKGHHDATRHKPQKDEGVFFFSQLA